CRASASLAGFHRLKWQAERAPYQSYSSTWSATSPHPPNHLSLFTIHYSPSREPPFFPIDKLTDRLDVVAIGNTGRLLVSLQNGRDEIFPSKLGHEFVPHSQIAFIKSTAVLETPFQNFLVGAAFSDPFFQVVVFNPQKIKADPIGRSRDAHVGVIFFR